MPLAKRMMSPFAVSRSRLFPTALTSPYDVKIGRKEDASSSFAFNSCQNTVFYTCHCITFVAKLQIICDKSEGCVEYEALFNVDY